ncbi:uclacyanin-3-like [Rhodamnia argentea]|uniref:Uclacyanin-3-like n=1 Tax=Rhodamnia argentea TaxID=178133 RepID=A0A8B8MPH9_9MYRT|nr:uclacyanin-3-like [Rhodamnia argentea]
MATGALLVLLLVATPVAYGAVHTLTGWCTRGDHQIWADGEKFLVNNTLVFENEEGHKVDMVNREDYESCRRGNALTSSVGGETTIALSMPGTIYFMCPSSGLCKKGMKMAIHVEEVATTANAATNRPCRFCCPPLC